jgi:hypothetical protein
MSDVRAILIIGATRGIGLELVNQAVSWLSSYLLLYIFNSTKYIS